MVVSLLAYLGVGLLYYISALIGVHFLSLPSGVVVFWPPNAVLLAAFLTLSWRHWPGLAIVVILAEVLADQSVFPVHAAVLFGLVNVAECAIAALLLQRFSPSERSHPDWAEPRALALFILITFFVASPIAALAGAFIYTSVLLDPLPFLVFWRIWWFGDATGLVALTPILHMMFNYRAYWPDALYRSAGGIEWAGLVITALFTSFFVFSLGISDGDMLVLSPLLVMVAPFWAAVRLGPMPASALTAAVVLYGAITTAQGQSPFLAGAPESAAILLQEEIMLFTVIVLFIAAFVTQIRRKSGSLHLYKSALEATSEGVLITEAGDDQPIIYCNQGFIDMTGYKKEDILGRNCRFLNGVEHDQPEVRRIREAILREEPIRITVRNFRKDGTLFWNNLIINPIRDWRGKTSHFVGIVRDISREIEQQRQLESLLAKLRDANETLENKVSLRTSELEEANHMLERLALTDELTGVHNRRNLISRGHLEVLRCSRSGSTFSIMLLDIDHFKQLNDQYGHEAGDLILQAFAKAVQQTIRKADSFGRWGGEEFMILVYDSAQIDLRVMGKKILKSIAECRVLYKGQALRVTASMGIATWQNGSFDQTVSMADKAMYQAKNSGRNRLVVYQDQRKIKRQ
ncbi:sensor domain-containing diguanylate cyclase [Marinobacter goseongensis]|uniref:sensor domain-containing diguanylate cyclase n=1 Tax=Marinobacter goseongensis TaxID=453838 RepID=UPI002004F909|nr:diguanylate cyclase [Marinobacter goseongensis]MCK7550739.1 diguanylate cyclase [Marinobacter goseongensis]